MSELVSCQRDRLTMRSKLDSGIQLPLFMPQLHTTTIRKPTTAHHALSATQADVSIPKVYTTAEM